MSHVHARAAPPLRHGVRRAAEQEGEEDLPQEHPLQQPGGAAGGDRQPRARHRRAAPGRVTNANKINTTRSLDIHYTGCVGCPHRATEARARRPYKCVAILNTYPVMTFRVCISKRLPYFFLDPIHETELVPNTHMYIVKFPGFECLC